jgi:serine/threonine protein kinase
MWCDGPHGGWLALDRFLGRKVVVNFPYRPDQESEFLERARLRARLRHANLIPIYDLNKASDGSPFFTEPHIEVTDVRTLLDRGDEQAALTLPQLVAYLRDACKAIIFLHANRLLHLDMHPGNVLVAAASGEIFVVLSRHSLTLLSAHNRTNGLVIGVPGYLAPEQVNREELGAPDVDTDVYGLGGILFEILYDQPPNAKRSTPLEAVITTLLSRNGPPRRGTLAARAAQYRTLAQRLEPVCLRALESDRKARHTSVSALIKDIDDASAV